MDERKRITCWIKPSEKIINSRHGDVIRGNEWLKRVKERIEESGLECIIIINNAGCKALFYVDGYYDESGKWIESVAVEA